jgi:(S)-2-hydroxy-acid oxidase
VDTPVLGNRINERKTPLVLPEGLKLANQDSDPNAPKKPSTDRLLMDARTSHQAKEVVSSAGGSMHSSSLTWHGTVGFLKQHTSMKIILKGIMTPEDAELAVHHRADAIVVSNHGGRQLDCIPSTIEALPDVVAAVQGRIPVILDGGIRRGSDIFKALALGADFVLVGRPALWGLSFKGEEGVGMVIDVLERELSRTMALAGTPSLKSITRSALGVRKKPFGIERL